MSKNNWGLNEKYGMTLRPAHMPTKTELYDDLKKEFAGKHKVSFWSGLRFSRIIMVKKSFWIGAMVTINPKKNTLDLVGSASNPLSLYLSSGLVFFLIWKKRRKQFADEIGHHIATMYNATIE